MVRWRFVSLAVAAALGLVIACDTFDSEPSPVAPLDAALPEASGEPAPIDACPYRDDATADGFDRDVPTEGGLGWRLDGPAAPADGTVDIGIVGAPTSNRALRVAIEAGAGGGGYRGTLRALSAPFPVTGKVRVAMCLRLEASTSESMNVLELGAVGKFRVLVSLSGGKLGIFTQREDAKAPDQIGTLLPRQRGWSRLVIALDAPAQTVRAALDDGTAVEASTAQQKPTPDAGVERFRVGSIYANARASAVFLVDDVAIATPP